MGLFAIPDLEKESVEDYIQTAMDNIQLWRKNPDCDYLLDVFAAGCLESAARLIRANEGRETPKDLQKIAEDKEMEERIDAQILAEQQSSKD